MAITNAIKNQLNRMNRAAQNALLGTRVQAMGYAGSTAVTTAQMSASAVIVYNALATDGIFVYQVSRSGSPLNALGFKHTRSGGSLTIIPFNSGSFNAGDIVNYVIA